MVKQKKTISETDLVGEVSNIMRIMKREFVLDQNLIDQCIEKLVGNGTIKKTRNILSYD